ncbi:protein LURP-one-related 17 [Cucurbita moschata]|uniref:Protein LURP-one-related 17 n=1 Tax=Cucurbita moschata TaxID=3662 RepID=A0A6J1EZ84_CUCMO|nr:protein LURP-one-related 17 [Cucurbita moschata]XP_022931367.1 protein LURP-one-related 17 [Cucurbita moschata]XP_022931368.1 protein LURP-one-related 17 [Cucurbita moschata]
MLFFKSSSGAVHQESQPAEEVKRGGDGAAAIVSLTVWRKSLLVTCNGFTVIDCNGNIVYRVDNYSGRPEEVILMDGLGNSVLTMCRSKKLGLAENWCVYEGEVGGETRARKKPICRVRKNMNILHVAPNAKVLAYVYDYGTSEKKYAYSVEGSYGQRSCKVLDASRTVVAEVKRKEAVKGGVCFGAEVFLLVILPGFDPGLAMALVLALDQMFS